MSENKKSVPGLMGISAVLVSMMPMERVLEEVQESLEAYKLVPTEENSRKLQNMMMMCMMKFDTINKKPGEILESFSEIEKKREALNNLTGGNLNQN